jgi:hypothetical protein
MSRVPGEVFAGVACPFTHVGLKTFIARCAEKNPPAGSAWASWSCERVWRLERGRSRPVESTPCDYGIPAPAST